MSRVCVRRKRSRSPLAGQEIPWSAASGIIRPLRLRQEPPHWRQFLRARRLGGWPHDRLSGGSASPSAAGRRGPAPDRLWEINGCRRHARLSLMHDRASGLRQGSVSIRPGPWAEGSWADQPVVAGSFLLASRALAALRWFAIRLRAYLIGSS